MSCLVYKKNVRKMLVSVSQILKMTSSNVSFCPKLKYIQFTDIEEGRNRTTFTVKKLESENVAFFALQKVTPVD